MALILGIDPGSNITGYGIIDSVKGKHNYIASGKIKMEKSDFAAQLKQIYQGISQLIKLYNPDEVAIEQVFMHASPASALKLGQARGVAIVAATENLSMISEYSARQVKQAVVGYGNADKSQIQQMVKLLLKIEKKLQADEADALAIAICHANFNQNYRIKVKL